MIKLDVTERRIAVDDFETIIVEVDDESDSIIRTVATFRVPEYAKTFVDQAARIAELEQWLGVVLDNVDYTSGACAVNEMIGGVLAKSIILKCRAILKGSQS